MPAQALGSDHTRLKVAALWPEVLHLENEAHSIYYLLTHLADVHGAFRPGPAR